MISDKVLLTFGESLLLSGIGMLVVFLELIALALMIIILSKLMRQVTGGGKKTEAPAPAAAAPVPAPAAAAPQQPSPPPAAKPAAPAGAAPWVGAATPAAGNDQVPQTEEEAKELLDSIFGNVVYKDA